MISQYHWDHLDYKTVKALKPKVRKVICGLGVGGHLEHWGFSSDQITECDWDESAEIANGISLHATPARHFSGRDVRRQPTLWVGIGLEGEDANAGSLVKIQPCPAYVGRTNPKSNRRQ